MSKAAIFIQAFIISQEAFNQEIFKKPKSKRDNGKTDKQEALKVLRGAEQRMFFAIQSAVLKEEEDKKMIPCLLLVDICLS